MLRLTVRAGQAVIQAGFQRESSAWRRRELRTECAADSRLMNRESVCNLAHRQRAQRLRTLEETELVFQNIAGNLLQRMAALFNALQNKAGGVNLSGRNTSSAPDHPPPLPSRYTGC